METVTYYSEGHVIVADLYKPEPLAPGVVYPAIVIVQGFTGIRRMPTIEEVGKALARAGYVAMSFDFRGYGDSGGERGRMAPLEQVDDIRNSLTYLEAQDFVDPDRLGLVGFSYGCLTAPHAAALDTRVKATFGLLGVATGYQAVTNERTPAEMAEWERKVAEARRRRVLFNEVDRTVRSLDVFIDDQSRAWLPLAWEHIPRWRNPMGFDSIGRLMDHRPIDVVHRISPRALGLLCAENDTTGDPKSLRELYEAAREPKRWVTVPGIGHYDLYQGELFGRLVSELMGFFDEFIGTR